MIKVKKLRHDAMIPTYGSEEAAGMDLYSLEPRILNPGTYKTLRTGVSIQVPVGWYGEIHPRSGWAVKYGLDKLAGVVDSDYRGELFVVLINNGKAPIIINKNDRIAQLVVKPHYPHELEEVEELTESKRGVKGFGSTGK